MNDSTTFYNSDAWVLLAIIYASRSGPATLDKIIAGGYITEHEGAFAPTDKALAYVAKVSQVYYSPS